MPCAPKSEQPPPLRRAGVFALRLLCAALFLWARPAAALELSPQEEAYVREHPGVPLCVDPDWEPFERINAKGEHEGIAADLLALVAKRTGLRFELVRTATWEESMEASQQGRCKALSFLNSSPKREQWLLFTEPLLNDPNVFITREEHPYILDPAGLSGETIAMPAGTAVEEMLRSRYPNLRILTPESEREAIAMVAERKASLTMRSLIMAASTIRKEGLFNLKIAGQLPEYANQLRMGVSKSEPVLRGILDKGVRSIEPQEREEIINRHVAINVQMGVDYGLVAKVAAGLLLALGAVLYWTLRLRALNRELKRLAQTDMLTGLYNRTKLDELLRHEFERARRYGRPLALVLLDIDRFKTVNDELGHLMGDKVLQAIARTALENIRLTDRLGRWGGEEFLVICPETTLAEALVAAERIRLGVAAAAFPSGRKHSLSAGVAALTPEDSVDSLLQRADTALYQAKNSGRDRVCVSQG